ncbi:MAG: DNA primase DnaG [Candidatus Aenigmatarchaeota archaeon]|nr:DNA primase [Candidatus Aenigmarchaeota archaeon]
MAKLAQATIKYNIYAKFEAEGMVEKPDVIGALFGQTEGLLGPEMDLRELQKSGRIGRIEAIIEVHNGKASGTIIIPSSLDSTETALIAACIETIERVGPCNAKIKIEKIEDVRNIKRKYIIDRAKDLLNKIYEEGISDIQELSEQLKESVRISEITTWNGLPSGPNIESFDEIIVVEGRADVLNLLRAGIKNVVAIEGTSIPEAIIKLSQEKTITVFLDGDRGGDLILKEIMSVADIDFVARAPRGKEVEELTKKEIYKSLRDKISASQIKIDYKVQKEDKKIIQEKPKVTVSTVTTRKTEEEQIPINILETAIESAKKIERDIKKHEEDIHLKKFKEILESLIGTRAACFINANGDVLGKVPVREIFDAIKEIEASGIIFDGEIDQKLLSIAEKKGIKYLIGMKSKKLRPSSKVKILTINDL